MISTTLISSFPLGTWTLKRKEPWTIESGSIALVSHNLLWRLNETLCVKHCAHCEWSTNISLYISFPTSFPWYTFSKSLLCSPQHSWPSILMCCTTAVAASISLFRALRSEVKDNNLWLFYVSQVQPKAWHQVVLSKWRRCSFLCLSCFPPVFLFLLPEKVEAT